VVVGFAGHSLESDQFVKQAESMKSQFESQRSLSNESTGFTA
jgi:hypothetical protein